MKYVILRNLTPPFNTFWSTNRPGKDQTRLDSGAVVYKVVGYAGTSEDAIDMVYKDMAGRMIV